MSAADRSNLFRGKALEALEPVLDTLVRQMDEHAELSQRVAEYKARDGLLRAEEERHTATKRDLQETTRLLRAMVMAAAALNGRCPDCTGRLAIDDHVPGCPLSNYMAKQVEQVS